MAAVVMTAAPVLAANASHPYQNVDKSNDKGNNTGNSKVGDLNKGQLDENQKPPAHGGVTTTPAAPQQ